MPHEFVCITDLGSRLPTEIKVIKLWDKCRELGGCFNRLYAFSPDMREIIGDRFACVDLDCVITGDVTGIFGMTDEFLINRYQPWPGSEAEKDQRYNGSLIIMDAGARRQVWDVFDPRSVPRIIERNQHVVGSDQAWIRLVLGAREKTLGPEHGIFEARNVGESLPEDARMVFFSGRRDPSLAKYDWVKRNWA